MRWTTRKAQVVYATDVGDQNNVAASGYGIVLATWAADFPTPGSFLVPLVDSRSVRAVGNANYARLSDPAIDALVDQARATGDPAAWREVATSVGGASAYVPLAEARAAGRRSTPDTEGRRDVLER